MKHIDRQIPTSRKPLKAPEKLENWRRGESLHSEVLPSHCNNVQRFCQVICQVISARSKGLEKNENWRRDKPVNDYLFISRQVYV